MKISYCHHQHSQSTPADMALEIVGLKVGYQSSEIKALHDFSIKIPQGKAIALVGPNGAGKSTLFKAIVGLLPFSEGSIKVFGHQFGSCHHRVVYLPQRSDIDWQFPMSVMDLVLTGRYVYLGWFKKPSNDDRQQALDALKQLGILDLANRQISKLSGGQQQRVLIARALVQDAQLLLLDEPLNAVDHATRQIVADVLSQLKAKGKTVIVATHYYDQEEGRYDGAIFLKDGRQVKDIDPKTHNHHEGCTHL